MSESMFHMLPFLYGLVFGTILVFFFKEQKLVLIDYPKPFDKKTYIDKNNMKYMYITKEVDCDKNESKLKSYPVQ
uniref:Uncharacterized protein n=1 Tax=viral metagenome TaxID=1070528 RepID=A0A6C0D802_9ZZZZ